MKSANVSKDWQLHDTKHTLFWNYIYYTKKEQKYQTQ